MAEQLLEVAAGPIVDCADRLIVGSEEAGDFAGEENIASGEALRRAIQMVNERLVDDAGARRSEILRMLLA